MLIPERLEGGVIGRDIVETNCSTGRGWDWIEMVVFSILRFYNNLDYVLLWRVGSSSLISKSGYSNYIRGSDVPVCLLST
jgi:hypothetical protein